MERRFFLRQITWSAVLPSLVSFSFFSKNNTMPADAPCKKAHRLQAGDTIGLVTPASPASDEKIQTAIKNLESQGFKVKYTDAIRLRYGHLAGTDAQRIDNLHAMFADPEVKAIWCVRGGYGCTRILPLLDYKLIRQNPKIIIGYSDVTALLNAIYQKTGLIGFHGPVGATPFTEYNVENLKKTLIEPDNQHLISLSKENLDKKNTAYQPEIIRSGKAQGVLVGGNLCLLASMVGTDFQVNFQDKIVFIEDVGEKPYRIDRMLTQLLEGSNLSKAKAIVLGIFEDCQPKDEQYSLSLIDTLKERLGNLNIPVMYGFSFGHIQNMCTLPIGVEAEFDADAMTLKLLEKAVI
jgi:muramoyltetrapeptide carboxypeptidase